jgi:LysM repeat protein
LPQHRSERRRRDALLAIPLAVATVTSLIFGVNVEHVETDAPTPADPGNHRDTRHENKRPAYNAAPDRSLESDGTYLVREGDTVASIAASFTVSSVELLAANGLSWRTLIFAGQRLSVPTSTSGTAEHDRVDTLVRHRVQTGDSLESIARAHAVQPRALMSANGLGKTSRLIVGQRLIVPNQQVMSELVALA